MDKAIGVCTRDRAYRNIRNFEHQIRECRTQTEICHALKDVIRSVVGASIIVLFPFYRRLLPESEIVLHSEHFDPKEIRDKLKMTLPVADREFGRTADFLNDSVRTRNVEKYYGRRYLEKTRTYHELFRLYNAEHYIIGVMGTKQSPLGFLGVTRSAKERPFSDREGALIEVIRRITESAVEDIAHEGGDCMASSGFRTVLAGCLPYNCAVLNRQGHIIWVNKNAEETLKEHILNISGNHVLCSKNAVIEAWEHAVQRIIDAKAVRLTLSDESSITRLGGNNDEPLYLIVDTTANRCIRQTLGPLTHAEREIFELAAQGLKTSDIASIFSISKSAVRGHMQNIFSKLGVHSRIELALRWSV